MYIVLCFVRPRLLYLCVCVYVLASFYTILRISNAIWKIICARMSAYSASSKSLSWAYEVNASRRSRDLKSEVHTAYRLFQAIYKQIFVYLCGTHIDNTLFDHTHHETLLLACIRPYLILESVFFSSVYCTSFLCLAYTQWYWNSTMKNDFSLRS